MLLYEPAWTSHSGLGGVVRQILKRTGSSGLAAAVVRQAGSSSWIQFVGAHGIPLNVLEAYAGKSLFYEDPFLRFAASDTQTRFRYHVLDAHKVNHRRRAGVNYLDFIHHYGMNIVGAGIRPLRSDIFLSVCFHAGEDGEKHDGSLSSAEQDIEALLSDIGLEILGKTLASQSPDPAGRSVSTVTVSDNDQRVIDLVVSGLMNKQIAFRLNISEDAVENRLRRIYRKFGVHNRTSLIGKVMRPAATAQ